MKKRKVLFTAVMVLAGLQLLSGCGKTEASANDTVVLRYAYASNSQPVIDSMKKFGELVEEKTDGKVQIEYFPDGQLGGETELIELTQTGAIDFAKVSGSALESFSKDYSVFAIPYIFDNEKHFFKVMDNQALMQPVYDSTKKLGFVGLTYYDSGQRSFYMSKGPVTSPDDLKGKKIRVMQSETAIKMVELLGGSPVPMGSSEVYTSLQSNLINGAENNEFVLYTAGHGGVAKYYSYDEHTRVPDIVIMNEGTKERLTAKQEQAIEEAAKESTAFEKTVFKEAVEEEKKKAQAEYGVVFNQVDSEPFQKLVQPLHESFKNSSEHGELIKEVIMKGFRKFLNRLLEILGSIILAAMVLVVLYQVFARTVLKNPSTLTEEFVRFALVWMAMLASAYVVGKKGHLAVTLLSEKLQGKQKRFLEFIVQLLFLLFAGVIMIFGGWNGVVITLGQISPSLAIPMGYVYLAVPVAGVLMFIYSLMNLLELFTQSKDS